MPKFYKPILNDKTGQKHITIPVDIKTAALYVFAQLPDGTLTYTPVKV